MGDTEVGAARIDATWETSGSDKRELTTFFLELGVSVSNFTGLGSEGKETISLKSEVRNDEFVSRFGKYAGDKLVELNGSSLL